MKSLVHKHEDLSSIPAPGEDPGITAHIHNPSPVEAEIEDPWSLLARQSSKLNQGIPDQPETLSPAPNKTEEGLER